MEPGHSRRCRTQEPAERGGRQPAADRPGPASARLLADLARPRRIAKEGGATGEGLDYIESFLLAVIDAALAAQNAVVALESLGLGTCYIGAIRNDPDTVARELALPEGVSPSSA
ncbi:MULTISPECIES: nitroreductase family protein [Rhizobium]|uniref:nitroreductase family protein n=1 Tax=Rhizobium phaseoli TaxID=396 RepID=UPI000190664B